MTSASSLFRLGASGLLLVLLASGCGSGDAEGSNSSTTDRSEPRTIEEATQALISCMQDKGWDATYDPRDQSMTIEGTPESQFAQQDADQEACLETTGLNDPLPELTDDQLSELYDHELATAACLREQGVSVPDAPSEQVFKDTYTTEAGYSAYANLSGVGEDRYYELLELCPQTPEGW